MVAVFHRRPCLQRLACCSVNSRHIGSESRFLPTPPAFNAPVRRGSVGISPSRLVRNNWNGVAARRWKNFEDIFIRFDTMHERDRHTDRHRHTPHDSIGCAYASHRAAKIMLKILWLCFFAWKHCILMWIIRQQSFSTFSKAVICLYQFLYVLNGTSSVPDYRMQRHRTQFWTMSQGFYRLQNVHGWLQVRPLFWFLAPCHYSFIRSLVS